MSWLDCGGQPLDLSQPAIMGVLNVTPDSFSDGGLWVDTEWAIAHAIELLDEGAAIIDIGGESTRPGADAVTVSEEIDRVIPVIQALHQACPDVVLSIDTSKPPVMRAALESGARMVNDVNALQADGALEVVADSDCGICLMHMQGIPKTMQHQPDYVDVVTEVSGFLGGRLQACADAGIAVERIVLDPGFGFGKALQHNLALLANLQQLMKLQRPLLVGLSRKSMLGKITGAETGDRMVASVSAALLAAQNGAAILRVHDVAATCQGLQVWQAMREYTQPDFI